MRIDRVSALVVSEDGAMIDGIVSDRGLMNALADQGTAVLDRPLGDVMTRDVFTCSRSDSVGAIMAAMTDRRIRHIPVVEEDGRLCGIVSIGDVVKHHLDEIQREASELREYISGSH
jgi:CBS domain-containing protein